VHIETGLHHSCALLDTGDVKCWGQAEQGQLGLGIANKIGLDNSPSSVGPINLGGKVIQLSSGDKHNCALLENDVVRCWGSNEEEQLGTGDSNHLGDDETPADLGDLDLGGAATQVALGGSHACVILETGAVRCWGLNVLGSLGYGLEGNQAIGNNETPADLGDIDLGGNAVQVSAGVFHTCALLDAGGVKCWGSNSDGELGYSNDSDLGDSDREIPVDSAIKLF
jgi:alpha-tubulin suppressor-like RCC1 family protein